MATRHKDRLTLAWELRRNVHAWILANPGASMPEIKAAFGRVNAETVRAVVRRMVDAGEIGTNGVSGHGVRYHAATLAIAPQDVVRDKMRAIGNSSAPRLAALNKNRARLQDGTYAPRPGRYVNRPDSKRAIANQGGQGAGGSWRGGFASCM